MAEAVGDMLAHGRTGSLAEGFAPRRGVPELNKWTFSTILANLD